MTVNLQGKRVVVTRPSHTADELCTLLTSRGAEPLRFPALSIQPPADTTKLDAALAGAADGSFDWIVMSSANAAYTVGDRLRRLGIRSIAKTIRFGAVGNTTAEAIRHAIGADVHFVPRHQSASDLGQLLPAEPGECVLVPESDRALSDLSSALTQRGLDVVRVVAYEIWPGTGGVELESHLLAGNTDALTFASPSAAAGLEQRLVPDPHALEVAKQVPAACIGTTTWRSATEIGFNCLDPPAEHSLEGLVSTLERAFDIGA